jgi:hypothetical protein
MPRRSNGLIFQSDLVSTSSAILMRANESAYCLSAISFRQETQRCLCIDGCSAFAAAALCCEGTRKSRSGTRPRCLMQKVSRLVPTPSLATAAQWTRRVRMRLLHYSTAAS